MGASDQYGSAAPRRGRRRLAAASAVPGLGRPSFWRSVRLRILLPVLLATTGLLVLGGVQIDQAVRLAAQADRSTQLARASGDLAELARLIAVEYVDQNHARRLDGLLRQASSQREIDRLSESLAQAETDLQAQRAATDTAVASFLSVSTRIRRAAPELAELCDAADRALDGITSVRGLAEQRVEGGAEVAAFYDQMIHALLAVEDALPAQMSDPRLIELSRSVALLGELHHLAALQFDAIVRAALQPELGINLTLLAEWVGSERTQAQALSYLRPAGELYADLLSDDAVALANAIRQVVLDGRGSISALQSLDPQTWFDAQTTRMEGLSALEQRLAVLLVAEARSRGAAARTQSDIIAVVSIGIAAATLATAITVAVRLSRRLRRTRNAALVAVEAELPDAIANVIAAPNAEGVRAALASSSQRINSMLVLGPDEIGELAATVGAVYRQALRLAADQAQLRMEVQAMFVALSRRGQTLVQRQIHLMDEFGRHETDPDALERLFALDHLAARMRRNEENLLVLAGGEPGRWITRPVALIDLVRAAAQEIEEYRRVEIGEVPSIAIVANVAGDIIHLLAELMENATSFSPPAAAVRVTAGRGVGGLVISVQDSGIGMPESRLLEANERLAHPSALTSTLVGTMGLLVVARLAQRHGIRVQLDSYPASGTTARVTLPDTLTIPLGMVERLQPEHGLRDMASASQAPAAASATTLPRVAPGQPQLGALQHLGAQPESSQAPSGRPDTSRPDTSTPHVPAPRRPSDNGPPTRPPGQHGPQAPPPANPQSPGVPDPEAVRARLSSLAKGLSAAQHDLASPPRTADRPRTDREET